MNGVLLAITVATVAIFMITIQPDDIQAFHGSFGITDEQLMTLASTNPEIREWVNTINSVGNDLLMNCGTLSSMVKENAEERTAAESVIITCDHNALYEKGMCLTHANMFSFCGELGSLQTYLKDRNLASSLPEKTFLGLDGSVFEEMTNTDLE